MERTETKTLLTIAKLLALNLFTCYQYVPTRRAQKCRFSECGISEPTAPREIRSNDLDSTWNSDHLYAHQIICFIVTMLQHIIKVSTGKRDLRLGKLRKSFGSFWMRCALGWALGDFRITISSLVVAEKTLKNMIFGQKNCCTLHSFFIGGVHFGQPLFSSFFIYLLSNLVELRPCGLLFHSTRL